MNQASQSSRGSIAGILLASGRGARFDASGQHNKLLANLAGSSVLRVSASLLCSVLERVIVVIPPDADALRSALRGLPVSFCVNPAHQQGMGSSLAAGVSALPDADGWIVALGDMPFIEPNTLLRLHSALLDMPDSGIVAPVYQGQRGHPVGFTRRHLPALSALQGDSGARHLLQQYSPVLLDCGDSGILRDIDTPQDLPA